VCGSKCWTPKLADGSTEFAVANTACALEVIKSDPRFTNVCSTSSTNNKKPRPVRTGASRPGLSRRRLSNGYSLSLDCGLIILCLRTICCALWKLGLKRGMET
jgi:hypothetical protein